MKPKSPLIDRQLKAYNNRDLKKFLSFYSKSIVIYDSLEGRVFLKGQKQLRERYKALFDKSPKLHCKILSRCVMGKYTVDREHVTGTFFGELHALVIYFSDKKKIQKVWMLRK